MTRRMATLAALLSGAGAALAAPETLPPFSPNEPLFAAFEAVRADIAGERWAHAEGALAGIAGIAPEVAEIWSLLGLAQRRQGKLREAEASYARALAIDPRHLGATEYLGELFLQRGDATAARGQLARLDTLCPAGCAERDDLAAAIADFEADAPEAAPGAAEPAR